MCAYSSCPRKSAADCSVTRFTQISTTSTRCSPPAIGPGSYLSRHARRPDRTVRHPLEVVADIDIEDPAP